MTLTIDQKFLNKHRISNAEALMLVLLQLPESIDSSLVSLRNKGILVEQEERYHIDPTWLPIINDAVVGDLMDESRLLKLAEMMRKNYPEGKMPGTPYYYRCNTREIAVRMKRFFTKYGNYEDERIIDAIKRFVASFNGNYKYLPLLKYFIFKNKTVADEDGMGRITEVSPLASFLENQGDDDILDSDDWLMNSKN